MKHVRLYLAIFGITTLLAFGVYFWLPDYRDHLLKEDWLIENISAGLFLISFISGLVFIRRSRVNRKETIIVSAISLLGFLDELSFGERHLDIHMRKIYDVKIDSVHDFVDLAYKLIVERPEEYPNVVILSSLIFIVTISFLLFLIFKYRSKLKDMIIRNYYRPPFIFLSLFVILVLFSLVIDLDIIENELLFMVEELCEMHAALALLFWCLSLQERPSKLERLYK